MERLVRWKVGSENMDEKEDEKDFTPQKRIF
jgi:hypothetical protein